MLISEPYRRQNASLHGSDPYYGTSGRRYVDAVKALADILKTRSILDYGCGKRTLERGLGFAIGNYDPCLRGLDRRPGPADIVVCTDVLEHIEPECLDAVLDDLVRVTRRAVFLSLPTGAASKTLPDGRNTHLIQQPFEWWRERLERRFRMCRQFGYPGGFIWVGQSLRDTGVVPDLSMIGPPPETKIIRTKSVYTDEQRCTNIRSSMLRGLPTIRIVPKHKRTMILACYGPSLVDTVEELRRELSEGEGDLYTVSGAHGFLINRGIVPIGHIESDPRPHKAQAFGAPRQDVCYFIASACDRAMFEALKGYEVWLHHQTSSNMETNLISKFDRATFTIDGGTNVGMSAIGLGTVLGYRDFSIYGMDCSFAASAEVKNWPKDAEFPGYLRKQVDFHAGTHPNEDQDIFRMHVGGKAYITSPQMMQGLQDFTAMLGANRNCRFWLRGDGLLHAFMSDVVLRRAA